jgi:hypothetical protein
VPDVGVVRPNRTRASVVLPLPLSPTTAVIDGFPVPIDNENPSSANV